MSEPRLISPLLDGYALGGPISSHSGVSCYPAMRDDSDERFIVKTISIPASQVQLEALLLTGAYKSAAEAQGYFRELAQTVAREVEILNKLAAQRGFLPYSAQQTVPMEDGVGYDVYLISPYQPTLERQLRRSPLTHLSAVNLGIDLCAALALCREAGYLYVDLKPGNIFLPGVQEYAIGDLGFISLNSLKYASLPDRYRSDYTPPEVADAFSTLNTTMDIYALGLVLYQIYNNGQLPFDSADSRQALMERLAAGENLPAPAYADYEMAEIIGKALAFRPEDRWQTPAEMGHALISYMQRNGANDVPIVPPAIPVAEPEPEPEEPELDVQAESAAEEVQETQTPEEAQEAPDWIDRMDAILAEDADDQEETDPDSQNEPSLRELLASDDYDPEIEDGITTGELSDETAGILSQAQELIDHDAPQPVVAPEPIDIPMPEPIVLEDEADQATLEDLLFEDTASETTPEEDGPDINQGENDLMEESQPEDEAKAPKKPKSRKGKRLLAMVAMLLVLAGLGFGGYYYYLEYYLQEIESITVDGQPDQMTVTVVTDTDPSLLTVVCTDTYGNRETAPLKDGQATFSDLKPGSQYIVSLSISGFHQLTGSSSASYSTPERTQVLNLSAITGSEDGSAIVSFAVEGPEGDGWTLTYEAPGEEPKSLPFTGHSVTVTGLTVGAEYTFTLTAGEDVYLTGENTLSFTASTVIFAQNLTISGYQADQLTASWAVPEGASVSGWTVCCYNEEGYNQDLFVTEPTATFTEVNASAPYTIDVTANGMTQGVRLHVTANPVTITQVNTEVADNQISVTWEYEGVDPEGGWLVIYTADSGSEQQVIKTDEPSATISPVAPGSHYDITIQSANATSVFGGTGNADIPEGRSSFSAYGMNGSNVSVTFYPLPDKEGWTQTDVDEDAATASFAPGDKIAVVYHTTRQYNVSYADVVTRYVFRDAEGKLAAISSSTRTWEAMWERGYCTDEISVLPAIPGSYTLEIYFDNALLTTKNITIE